MVLSHSKKIRGARKFVGRLLVSTALVGVVVAVTPRSSRAADATWNGAGVTPGPFWGTPDHWSTGAVPTVADRALVTGAGGANQPTIFGANTFSTGAVDLSGGTLDIQAGGTLNGVTSGGQTGLFNQSGGALTSTGGGGALNVDTFTMTGGTATGVTITAATAFNLTGVTVGANLTGAGVLTSNGAVTLNGINTYSGATTIASGTLTAGVAGAFSANSNFVLSAGTLNLNNLNQTIGNLDGAAGTSVSLGSATLTFGSSGANATYVGAINGTGTITKVGGNVEDIFGVNGYSGATTVNGGVLRIGAGGSILNSAAINLTNGRLDIIDANAISSAVAVTLTNGLFAVNASQQIGSLNGDAASSIAFSGATPVLTTGGNNTNDVFAGTIGFGVNANGALVKIGGSVFTLSGNNGYTGGTSINAGTLSISADNNLGGAAGGLAFNTGTLNTTADIVSSRTVTINTNAAFIQTAGTTLTLNGQVTGAGSIFQQGPGTLALTNGSNNYGGVTSISGGTLAVGASGALSAGTVQFVGNATLSNFNNASVTLANNIPIPFASPLKLISGVGVGTGGDLRLDGVISDAAGSLSISNASTSSVILTGANTYGGGTAIAGLVGVGSNTAFGTGTMNVNGLSGLFTTNAVNAGPFTLANNIVLNSGLTVGILGANPSLTLSGNISGADGLVLSAGAGTVTLSGTNTYGGATTISSGTIEVQNGAALPNNTAVTILNDATARLLITNSETIGSLAGTGPNGSVSIAAAQTLTTGGNNASTTFGGVITGAGAITKAGTGTFVLNGANGAGNQFTGAANVNGGILSIGSGAGGAAAVFGDTVGNAATVNVNNGGTLQGIGTIRGTVTVNNGGTLAAGNSPGTLTVNALTLNSGSISNFELGTAGAIGGATNDLVRVTNALTINTGATLSVAAPSAGFYQLFQYGSIGGTAGNFAPGDITATNTGLGGAFASATTFTNIPGQLNLTLLGPGQTTHFWDADGTANGTIANGAGAWDNTTPNWTSDATNAINGPYAAGATPVAGLVAIFGSGAAAGGAIAVTGTQYFDTLQFLQNGYVISGGTLAIQPATGSAGVINTMGNTVTINSVIANGTGIGNQLQKVGSGTLVLGGVNTYTGGTDLQAGTIQVTNGAALGTGVLAMSSGTALQAGASVSLANAITLAAGAETIDSNGSTLTLTGGLSGAGALTKTGTGTLVLASAASYAGLTTIAQDTLQVTAGGSIASGALVNPGATLTNAGAVNGGVTNNGTIVSTNTITGGVTNTGSFSAAGVVNGAIANNSGTFAVTGNLNSDSTFANAAPASLNVNTGTYTLAGLLTNSGSVVVAGGAALTANAGIVNTTGGFITNNGTITDDFTNSGSAINNGVWNANATNTTSGSIANNGTWNGTITNAGTFNNAAAAILNGNLINTGTVNAAGTINGAVTNSAGVFTVTGGNLGATSFANASGASLAVTGGNLSLTGALANSGTITVAAARVLNAVGGTTNASNGSISNTGTLSGGVSNAGTLNTSGLIAGGLNNSGTVNASGAINGGITNSAAFNVTGSLSTDGSFTNTGSGTIALANSFTGLTTLNNAGTINVTGSQTLGVATLNNQSTGFISLINGSTADRLTVTGNYAGTSGSRIGVDAALTSTPSGDAVTINGTASGASTIVVNLPNALRQAFATPVTVLSVANGSPVSLGIQTTSASGASAVTPVSGATTSFLRSGFVNYSLQQVQNGGRTDYQIISSFNSAPAASVASSVSGVITGITAGFHQAASAIVSRPDDCKPNQLMGGPFIRMSGGDGKVNLNGSTSGGGLTSNGATGTNSTFAGFQTGADIGVCNINGSEWNFNTGVFGGGVHADASASSSSTLGGGVFTKAKLDVPFVGTYAFVSKGNFTFELNYRHDFYDARITTPDPSNPGANFVSANTQMKGDGNTLSASAGYKINVYEAWYIEPQVGISKSFVDFGYLKLGQTNIDYLKFGTIRSLLGRAGANVGTAFLVTDKLVVAPFVTLSVWKEFGPSTHAEAVLDTIGSRFDVRTERVGTFGQAGGGLQFKLLDTGVLGFVRSDFRFGDKISGKAINAGFRYQF